MVKNTNVNWEIGIDVINNVRSAKVFVVNSIIIRACTRVTIIVIKSAMSSSIHLAKVKLPLMIMGK
jgi:hypothetical protein